MSHQDGCAHITHPQAQPPITSLVTWEGVRASQQAEPRNHGLVVLAAQVALVNGCRWLSRAGFLLVFPPFSLA